MKQARGILRGKLRFGDAEQVAALRFLREVEVARNRILLCRHCQGGGLMQDNTACQWCAAEFPPDVLHALGLGPDQMPP